MKTQTKLKIIPGRGLTGKDIKMRLRNRTIEGEVFGKDSYTLNESMSEFTKMSKVEQINAARANNAEMRKLQREMEEQDNLRKQRATEQEIERKVQDRLKELGNKIQSNQNSNN